MTSNNSVIFDTFNARNLSFEQVAATFVPNKQFNDLIDNNHTLLMGPRGSGKTTLLKMLTPMAVNEWIGNEAKNIRAKIPFWGIYIPTDTQFKTQLEYICSKVDYSDYILISRTVVATNILVSLCKTFKYLSKEQEVIKEIEVSKSLIDAWKLPRPISPTFHSIERALLLRVGEINNFINKLLYRSGNSAHNHPASALKYPDYFFEDFLPMCDFACSAFEETYSDLKKLKWALCFDELELAPRWLQGSLLELLRSTSQRFLFKLTTSPVITSDDVLAEGHKRFDASLSNDFKVVRTWPTNYSDVARWKKFCDKLVSNKLRRHFDFTVNPLDVFGSDSLERSVARRTNSKLVDEYGKGSLTWNLIIKYSEIDESLKKFLIQKGINPVNPVPSNQAQRDQIFRKIKQILVFRYAYTFENRIRPRKNAPLFYGVPYIYEICDGNPRQLMGLVDELISRIGKSERNIPMSLAINTQSAIISETSSRYLKLLATHPDANVSSGNKQLNASVILQSIGEYFHEKLIQESFTIDPVGSFIVDEVDKKILHLIEFAVTYGALVHVNPTGDVTSTSIVGKRFRLSYLLSPTFKLPKRDYSAVNLSTILNYQTKKETNQLKIF